MIDLKRFRKYKKISQQAVSAILNCKQSFVSQVEIGDRPMPADWETKLREHFGNEIDSFVMSKSEYYEPIRNSGRGVPYYDLDVTCGINESFADIREVPQYFIDLPPFNDCTAAFPVYGESMEPDFFGGEIIIVKEVHNLDVLLWGEPYLVITDSDTDNLRTIKNVYPSKEREYIILRASNERFAGDTPIPRASIVKMYLVKGKLSRRQM